MKLDKLHVDQFRAGVVRERLSVTSVFPGVAGDSVAPANSARGQDDGFRFKNLESSPIPIVPECTRDAVAVLKQRDHRMLHVHFNSLMNPVFLLGSVHSM